MAELGEQARVVSELPVKLVLVDRAQGMLPFMPADPDGSVDAGLVVHRSTLLEAMIALFDLYWERATPLRAGDRDVATGVAQPPEEAVLTLMAAGYKDEAIANQLGISTATVRRRITWLSSSLSMVSKVDGAPLSSTVAARWPPASVQWTTSPVTSVTSLIGTRGTLVARITPCVRTSRHRTQVTTSGHTKGRSVAIPSGRPGSA